MNLYNEKFFKELQKFIKKYHLIKFVQSALFGISLILIIYLILVVFNYFFYPSIKTKKVIFFFFSFVTLAIFFDFILLKFLPIIFPKKRISYKQAAILLIESDTKFDDRLLSIIDLSQKQKADNLIIASIKQKINELKFISFSKILNLKSITKSLKYLGITLIFIFSITIINVDIIKVGTEKLINYSKYYPKPMPFKFIILNKNLTTKQDSNFVIHLLIKGSIVPQEVFIVYNNQKFLMYKDKNNSNTFFYVIRKPQNDLKFYFNALGYNSKTYTLKIKYLPIITSSKILVVPPSYTQLKAKTFYNITRIKIPEASLIKLSLKSQKTDTIIFCLNQSKYDTLKARKTTYYTMKIFKNANLKIILKNSYGLSNYLNLKINTIPDNQPYLEVNEKTDSNNLKIKYFDIKISDDYGFSKLNFYVKTANQTISYNLPISNKNEQNISFAYSFDSLLKISPKIEYFFIVCDNKTPKPNCTKSIQLTFSNPNNLEIANQIDSLSKLIEEKAQTAKNLSNTLKELANQYRQRLLTENLSQWERKEQIRELQQKTSELHTLLEEIQNLNKQKNNIINSFSEYNLELEQKQKALDEVVKNILNKDLQKLLEELQNILKNNNAQVNNKKFTELTNNYQQLNEKLNKTLDFFKKLAIEQMLNQQSQTIKDLQKKQDSILKALKNKKSNTDKLAVEQEKLQNQLEQTKKEYEKIIEENKTLNNPLQMEDLKNNFENIKQMMQQNQQLLRQEKRLKSKKLQQNIIDSLNTLSNKIKQNLQTSQKQAQLLDLIKIYRLIVNIEYFSISVENILNKTVKLKSGIQSLPVLEESIIKLRNQFIPIKDSLLSLSAQNLQLSRIVDDKIYSISVEINNLAQWIEKRQKNSIIKSEKIILENTNIILLILTQIANSIEKQMKNAMPSMQQNQGQQKLASLQQLQSQLQKELEKLLKLAQQGKLNAKDFEQSLIFKEKINSELYKLLEEYANSLEVAKKLKEIQKNLKQIEKKLVNKQIDESLLKNSKLMKVKLWEAENAIKKQNQYDNKRVAEHQKQIFYKSEATNYKPEKTQFTDFQSNIRFKTIKFSQFYFNIYKNYRYSKE